jgi:Uma2 family endonuclease
VFLFLELIAYQEVEAVKVETSDLGREFFMVARPSFSSSPEEYLEWEEQQEIRYEYLEGEVYAMTGGTLPHNEIAVNFVSLLKNHLRGRSCRILNSAAKVISSDAINVEIFRLNEKGKWELTSYAEGDEIELTSIDYKFSIELLYEDIMLAPIEKVEE